MQNPKALLPLFLLVSACASVPRSNPTSAAAPSEGEKLEIIDVHTHTIFKGMPLPLATMRDQAKTQEDYFREFKEAGVVGAVAHTIMGDFAYTDLRAHNVIHCGGVGLKVDADRIAKGLASGKYACMKIYLGYIKRYAYDPAYDPIYKLAEKFDVPVVFHTGDTITKDGMLKYADPLTIDEVAVRHPKVRLVIAHCGNPWIESAAEVAYKNPNVYLDGSAFQIGNLNEMPREKVDEYVVKPLRWIFGYVENPEKLMFGTDWPLTNIASYVEPFKRAIPREYWKDVFHDNALKVFKALKARPGSSK